MRSFLEAANRLIWGVPTLLLILVVGILICVKTRFVQFRLFPDTIRTFVSMLRSKGENEEGVSPYGALCTALAATVGTGNLAGVAGAIAIGGPGAVFWMWICALLGMGIKFAEASLAVYFRKTDGDGNHIGGPMYMIENGMGKKWCWLGRLYCFFGVIAAFGVGNATQINAVIGGINHALGNFGIPGSNLRNAALGLLLAVTILSMLLGGAKRIGQVAERLVPFASVLYILLGMGVLLVRISWIPQAFHMIFNGAFTPAAVTGGAVGSMFLAMRIGTSRGIFTNEAGMGTASIAHAGANVRLPAQQGMMGIMEVFLDTIVICTMTALVILCSGVYIPYGTDEGVQLTLRAFSSIYGGWISIPISLCLCLFAFATVLGWGLYGLRCAQYLFGDNAWKKFAYLQAAVVVISSVLKTDTVWLLAESVNGLMALPNLIALYCLMPNLKIIMDQYKKSRKSRESLDKIGA